MPVLVLFVLLVLLVLLALLALVGPVETLDVEVEVVDDVGSVVEDVVEEGPVTGTSLDIPYESYAEPVPMLICCGQFVQ